MRRGRGGSFNDYTGRLVIENPIPTLPGSDPPPFGFNVPKAPQFQTDANRVRLENYARAFTDFFYQFEFEDIAANTQMSQTKRIQNDSFFAAMFWILERTDACDIQLADASRQLIFSDVPMDSDLCMGSDENPFWLPNMIIFNPNSVVTFTVWDTSGSENDVKILLGGRRYHI